MAVFSEVGLTLVLNAAFLLISIWVLRSSVFSRERLQLARLTAVGFRHPVVFLAPFLAWVGHAALTIYFRFYFPADRFEVGALLLVCYGAIALGTALIAVACLFILKILEQIETGQPVSGARAALATAGNLVVALPIVVIWASLDFVIVVLRSIVRAVLRGSHESEKEEAASLEGFARALGGYEQSGSLLELGVVTSLGGLSKCIRLIAMLSLTSLVWGHRNPFSAMSRAIRAVSNHPRSFAARYAVSWAVVFALFLPPGLLLYVSEKLHLNLPAGVWLAAILYIGLAWSFMIYSELVLMAGLYLWHIKWLQANRELELRNERPPRPVGVKPPSFADDIPDLLGIRVEDR